MKRRLLNALTLVSLLLCVAAVTLWVRSQFVSDYVAYDGAVDPGLYARCWICRYTNVAENWNASRAGILRARSESDCPRQQRA